MLPNLYQGTFSFRVLVPQGATSLTVRVFDPADRTRFEMFLRYEQDNLPNGTQGVISDHRSGTWVADATLTVTPASNPPRRPGTYYVSFQTFIFLFPTSA